MDYENLKKFLVYESWVEYLLETAEDDREEAKEIWWQILLEASGAGMDTQDRRMKRIISKFIMPNVKASQTRYENKVSNGNMGGRPKDNIDQALVFELKYGGATYQEIADQLGVHKNTIQNRMNEWRAEYDEYKNTKTTKTENKNNKNQDNNNKNQDKDIEKDIDSYTTTNHFSF